MKKIKKSFKLISIFILILAVLSPLNVFADYEVKQFREASWYFCEPSEDGLTFNNKIDEIIKDNYWSKLEKVEVENINLNYNIDLSKNEINKFNFNIAIPKYLTKPDETEISKYSRHKDFGGALDDFSFGIIPGWTGLNYLAPMKIENTFDESNNGHNARFFTLKSPESDDFQKRYNITTENILTNEEVSDAVNKLQVLGDLKKQDSKDSKKIDILEVNDNLNLDFSINASWFNRLYNSLFLAKCFTGGFDPFFMNYFENLYVKNDAEIVYSLDIPDGVNVDKNKLKGNILESKNGVKNLFDVKTEISKENISGENKDVVLVRLSLKQELKESTKQWKDLLKEIRNVDTSKIVVRIEGLSVAEDVKKNENITINATASALYDFATFTKEDFPLVNNILSGTTFKGDYDSLPDRYYWSFAAVQDPDGLDEAAPKDKPNLISYTFKVKEGEVTPTPTPEPEPTPLPEPEIKPPLKNHEYVETHPVITVVDKKGDKKEPNTHDKYIVGYPDDTIRPDGDMTRAEAIAVVARLQKLDLSDKSSKIYKDTKADMWYNGAINAAYREGYLLEKEGENVRPNDKITRAELAELISHIDKKNNALAPFEDVKGHKFEAAINQAYGNERIKGYPDGTFKPDNTITRAEVATMLNKLYDRYPDEKFIDANQDAVHNYKDMSHKGHWGYYELVEAYHSHNYLRLSNNMEEWKNIIK